VLGGIARFSREALAWTPQGISEQGLLLNPHITADRVFNYNSLAKLRRGVMAPKLRRAKSNAFTTLLARLPLPTEFARSGVRHSILLPFAFCSVVGIMTAFMGVGG
jgi:hypothetical protein